MRLGIVGLKRRLDLLENERLGFTPPRFLIFDAQGSGFVDDFATGITHEYGFGELPALVAGLKTDGRVMPPTTTKHPFKQRRGA